MCAAGGAVGGFLRTSGHLCGERQALCQHWEAPSHPKEPPFLNHQPLSIVPPMMGNMSQTRLGPQQALSPGTAGSPGRGPKCLDLGELPDHRSYLPKCDQRRVAFPETPHSLDCYLGSVRLTSVRQAAACSVVTLGPAQPVRPA